MPENNHTELVERVQQALSQVRPYMEADGGDVSLVEITEDMVARIQLLGACSSCKMSLMTLKAGVEESIRKVAPEIRMVEAVN